MHAAFRVADEWPFQVNANGRRAAWASPIGYGFSQMFQRLKNAVLGSGYGGWQVGCYSVPHQLALNFLKRRCIGFHYVMPGAAVNVDVNESGRQYQARKIQMTAAAGHFRGEA
jgi:hypothetical protein